ncbi:MAG: hypothetical protein BGO05_21210 [Rhizobiales bacterium 63-7]|uniref:DUF6107 family protein n=1 Tax=Rhizobium sp. YJ-22 TaxID=3037556 RepID=UPI0009286774|nr:DUF6107 family protein [Rhizobium sp. YJ-22]MBN9029007.1 hypothetical protein [Hyphomicrobiales bacterium]MDG3574857.1 DUF6107 family protein [Rhizobium sp. YJ-22]OJU71822.1 MAG: hypothetical protein BGO05_21210 [Rhizobiales bacterium 63-7]
MADFGNEPGLWAARAAGASAGAAVSLIYLLPQSRREAAGRFFTGLTCGLIFGAPTGAWLIDRMQLAGQMSPFETLLAGSAAASLGAWWALGILARIAGRYGARPER